METAERLIELEAEVSRALRTGDAASLSIVGFGEVTVALALGDDLVAKRMPPFSTEEFEHHRRLVDEYCAGLRGRGVRVVDTEMFEVPRDGDVVGYLVQPRLDRASLGDARLRAHPDPVAGHPVLTAIGEAVLQAADERISLDAQVTNWSFSENDDGGLDGQLLDVGTPMVWDAAGRPELDMTPFLAMIPRPLRPVMRPVMTNLMERWKKPEGVLLDAVANLYREGLPEWAGPAARTWGDQLGVDVDLASAEKAWAEDRRLWPFITRLKRSERWWRSRRGEPYDFFIQTTFGTAHLE